MISLDSRNGSPATNGARAIAPVNCSIASGLLGSADEDRACGLGRPELPLHVLRRDRLAELDVDLGDQDLDGVDRGSGHGLRGRRLLATTAGEQRGSAAGGDGDHENDKTRGFHTLHFPQ